MTMAESPFIFEIDASNYQQIVIQGSHQVPILVDFWASWCQPCQMLMPVLARLADEYNGAFILAKINTEEQQEIAAQFGIRSIPTVKLFKNGVPVDEFAGALPESEIRNFLDKHLPRASDGMVAQAEHQLAAGDITAAIASLQQARDEDPNNPRVSVMLAQAQMAGGDIESATALLDALPAEEQAQPDVERLRGQLFFAAIADGDNNPEALAARLQADPGDSAARYVLAAHQVLQGRVDDAAEGLLSLMQKDRKFGDDAARIALLKLFDLLADDPAVNRYRARLFNLLH